MAAFLIGAQPNSTHVRLPASPLVARALYYAFGRFKAICYIAYFRLRGVRFKCGPRLRVFGRLQLRGPGEVLFGSNVAVHGKVTPWTHAPGARIVIGDNVVLSSTRFGCVSEITIEKDSLVADARIMDTDFHSIRADRRDPNAPVRVAPVHVSENVWISASAALLPGTKIGRNSVVGLGAVCMGTFPADQVILGNPARAVMPIPTAR